MKDFTFDVDRMIDTLTPNTKLIFIANPNNPTGTMIAHSEAERLLNAMPEKCLLVMDEAYYEYVERTTIPGP